MGEDAEEGVSSVYGYLTLFAPRYTMWWANAVASASTLCCGLCLTAYTLNPKPYPKP